jgi:RNA polymerase sigma factor (TIGR02999 family)
MSSSANYKTLVRAFNDGDPDASGELFEALYQELRGIARRHLGGESDAATVSPTVLVHEAYLKFSGGPIERINDNRHFIALIARVMRQWMVDRARRQQAAKRGNRPLMATFVEDRIASDQGLDADELLALDEALTELRERDPDMANVVEFRYFVGFTIPETASALDVSERTVARLWSAARAWLLVRMKRS